MLTAIDMKVEIGLHTKKLKNKIRQQWQMAVVTGRKRRVLLAANSESELVEKILAKFDSDD
jgi:hypothetical protein